MSSNRSVVQNVTTAFLPLECTAAEMQRAIEATRYVGNVLVYKRTLPLCHADGTGCGENYEHGFGSTYQIVFLSMRVARPNVTVVSIKYPGQLPTDEVRVLKCFTLVYVC
ncbi:hypothetical protein EON64_00365 [archaeon]|nr:MAG: hypothetical protein EON64_00365 [archaeon]